MDPDETHPITSLGVKSVIAQPIDNSSIMSRQITIRGAAWAGRPTSPVWIFQPIPVGLGVQLVWLESKSLLLAVMGVRMARS